MTVPTRLSVRKVRRLVTYGVLLVVLGLVVPNAGHTQARIELIKLDQVHGLDATDNVTWILALGSDARPGQPVLGSRSDAIQLTGINTVTHHGVTIGVPRDSYVDIPGVGRDKINAAMVYGGAPLAAQAVANLTGITPDYVLVTSFKGLKKMVTGIHGVRAKVSWPMPDLGYNFHPGMHTFTGKEALAFARIRHPLPLGDFQRSFDQGQLLKGGLSTVKSKMTVPGFYERALGLLAQWTDTNMSPIEMYRLGRDVLEVNPAKVQTCVLAGGIGSAGGASIVVPDVGAAQALGRDVLHDATVNHGCNTY
jgi:LCP family protein required for cell wall assembly